jgi:hypothetical protein
MEAGITLADTGDCCGIGCTGRLIIEALRGVDRDQLIQRQARSALRTSGGMAGLQCSAGRGRSLRRGPEG